MENLVENAEAFILDSESEDTVDVREMRFDFWRIVAGEQRGIFPHLVSIQPRYMGELESIDELTELMFLIEPNYSYALEINGDN